MSATWTTTHAPARLVEVPRTRHALLAVLLAVCAAVVALGLLVAAMTSTPAGDAPSTGGAPTVQAPRPSVQPIPLGERGTTIPASLLRQGRG